MNEPKSSMFTKPFNFAKFHPMEKDSFKPTYYFKHAYPSVRK